MNLDEVDLPLVRTHGMIWIATEDEFTFDSQVNEEFELTKRNFCRKWLLFLTHLVSYSHL